jgi:hypothetical protein
MKIHFRTSIIAAALLAASPALAETGVLTVEYPEDACHEIIATTTGSSHGSTIDFVEILCKDADGRYASFLTQVGSVRKSVPLPDRIDYRPYDGDTLRIRN